MPLLTRAQVDAALSGLAGWRYADGALQKEFVFAGFPEAIAFLTRLVPGAEEADHHPDLRISYKRVFVIYATHSEGGVTEKDIAGAHRADQCA